MAQTPKTVDEFVTEKFREYLKVYLVLKHRGHSWKRELQNSFSIADSIVHEGLKVLEKDGFIISKDIWSLDLDMQEVIKRQNGAYFEQSKRYPKIYVLNQDEIRTEWFNVMKEDIEKLIKDDGSMIHTIDLIANMKKGTDKLLREFKNIENNQYERRRFTDSNVLFITETKKTKEFKKNLKQAILEFKQERLQSKKKLKEKERNQL